ncbi:hypothetical protein J6590_076452 [Homalodisca vitripennis]|nr:hypothetical protein J6590_076452 [Homalodisca vitripennis]
MGESDSSLQTDESGVEGGGGGGGGGGSCTLTARWTSRQGYLGWKSWRVTGRYQTVETHFQWCK